MFNFIIGIMIFFSLLLIGVTLLQNSKSEGLGSSLGTVAGSQIVGVKKSADTLENITWFLLISILALAVISASLSKKKVNNHLSTINTEEAKKNISK